MNKSNDLSVVMYHGTDISSALNIVQNGFVVRDDPEGWLGRGVYFFVDGIRDGLSMAVDWSRFRAETTNPVVVIAEVTASSADVLDLRDQKELQRFDRVRQSIVKRDYVELATRRDLTVKKRRDIRLDDAVISRRVMAEIGKSILIHNVYLKTQELRDISLESSYPTSTVCCVGDTKFISISGFLVKKEDRSKLTSCQRSADIQDF